MDVGKLHRAQHLYKVTQEIPKKGQKAKWLNLQKIFTRTIENSRSICKVLANEGSKKIHEKSIKKITKPPLNKKIRGLPTLPNNRAS